MYLSPKEGLEEKYLLNKNIFYTETSLLEIDSFPKFVFVFFIKNQLLQRIFVNTHLVFNDQTAPNYRRRRPIPVEMSYSADKIKAGGLRRSYYLSLPLLIPVLWLFDTFSLKCLQPY